MKKKKSRGKLIRLLDSVFSKFIRLRDANIHGIIICPLCGNSYHWKDSQAMHFIKRSVYKYRRDENNVHAGCYRCNVLLKGNYILYTRYMQTKYGITYVDDLIDDSLCKVIYKISTPDIENMINCYKLKVIELEKCIKN